MSDPQFHPRPFARKFPIIIPCCYVLGKVLTDPLYPAVLETLRLTREPLLDVGCGMGVLAFYLRDRGWDPPCTCVDVDAGKIAIAKRIQHRWPGSFHFHAADAVNGLPAHSGSVTLLDMLQYLPHSEQKALLISAAARVSQEGVLVIRNAMAGDSSRHGVTKIMDKLAGWSRWITAVPKDYPHPASICEILSAQGLHGEFKPLWGRTPFHNWFGVFRRKLPA